MDVYIHPWYSQGLELSTILMLMVHIETFDLALSGH